MVIPFNIQLYTEKKTTRSAEIKMISALRAFFTLPIVVIVLR